MKRIIPVYIFQQVNVLLVSLYLLKFLCIGELTILQILYGTSLISFLWMYGQRKQAHKIDMKSRMKWLGIGFVSLLIISLFFSLIHAQGSTNQANLIGLSRNLMEVGQKIRHQNCVDKCFVCLSSSSRDYSSLVFVCFIGIVFRDGAL